MARSIHTTRRTLRELSGEKFPDSQQKHTAIEEAADSLSRKRRIKRMVRSERRLLAPTPAPTDVSTIPIDVRDEGEFVHHGASADDIRAILDALPESARLGVSRIQLSLGKAYMDERAEESGDDRDPFTKRIGSEVLPGVYCGEILGCFTIKSGLVSVYAYVFDRNRISFPLPLCKFYLRLQALKTFVHEMAHHHDRVARMARGRWRSDQKHTVEWYAEKMEHQWTNEIVLPYLERTYRRDAAALRNWVAHRGGLRVGLDFFAGDTRRTERNGLQRLVFTTPSAFESWVEELPKCKTLAESRLAFAWELHYCDLYALCLGILNSLLTSAPDWIPALTCKADTLVHLERLDEALLTANHALELAPTDADAWETRGDVFECQDKWEALLENCDAWERSGRLARRAQRDLLLHRAIAHCAMDRISEMEAVMGAHLALFNFKTPEIAARRRKFAFARVFRRAGKPVPEQYSSKKP